MRAYVFIKAAPKYTPQLMNDLQGEPHVVMANIIHGPYDCLIEVDAHSLDEINGVVERIRMLDGVQETLTSLVMHSWHRDSLVTHRGGG